MRSAILLAFVALYGCASAPGYRSSSVRSPASFREDPQPLATSPEDHPLAPAPEGPHPLSPSPSGRGGTTDGAAVSLDYWERLGDTTLSRLVGEVLPADLDVRSARARVSAARSDRVRSVLDLTPSATVAAGYSRQRLSTATFPGALGVFPDQNVWDAGVNASWDLDVFGGIRHTVQARGALGRGPGRSARRAGEPDRGSGPRLFRAAGSAGAAPSGPAERREPAPHVRPYEAAARRGARQRVRYGAGASAAQLDAGLDSRA